MEHPPSQLLSEYLDGDIPAREAEELEAHLNACATCRALLRDLREVQARARSLTDQLPEQDLWPGIARALVGEAETENPQVIELHPRTPAISPPASLGGGFRLSYLQAAAAGLALALFSGGLGALLSGRVQPADDTLLEGPPPWVELVSLASPELGDVAREVAHLEGLLDQHRAHLDPETARILEKNLAVIDAAIQESLRALESDPGNVFLERHLARSVEAKGNFLREAASFVVPVG